MIIKLTDVRNDGSNPVPTFVNMSNVLTFNKSINGKDTHVKLVGNAFLFVRETPEEIIDKMFPKMEMPEMDLNEIDKYWEPAITYGAR